jgi:two-component system, OmpR family, KDP operon response regulator KdpE
VPTKNKILLVDDEPAILKVLAIKLKISGYDVVCASNGEEALKLVRESSPDLALLDVILPGMDGLQLLHEIRSFSKIPVIVFSARPENAATALSLGANDFLTKPFDTDTLMGRIRTLLRSLRTDV